jgi:hypothetical protein
MAESNDRKELERRLEQAKRIADLTLDPLTKERLQSYGLAHKKLRRYSYAIGQI